MPLITHPLDHCRIPIDIPEVLPVNEERASGSVRTEKLQEIGGVLVRAVVEGECYRSGGRASLDDGTNRYGGVGCHA